MGASGRPKKPRRTSVLTSPDDAWQTEATRFKNEVAALTEKLVEARRQRKCMVQKLLKLKQKLASMAEAGDVAHESARTAVAKQEASTAVAELIKMRDGNNGLRSKLSAEQKLWADNKTHANPSSLVGNWKAQTDADIQLFKVKPEAYKPMSGGSIYRTRVEVDAVKMVKERIFLQGKRVQVQFDLTPIAKRDLCGTSVTFSVLEDDGTVSDYELVLTLTWVAGKDGRVIAQRVREVLLAHGIPADDVVWAITDGGGDNHGGNTDTGHGNNGTVAQAVGKAVWLWCQVHMAQLVYKDSMKKVPDGFLGGLKEVV